MPSRNVPIVVGVYGNAKVPTPRMDRRLYNLRDDPGEHENLIANQPDRAGELDRMLRCRNEELIAPEMKFFESRQSS